MGRVKGVPNKPKGNAVLSAAQIGVVLDTIDPVRRRQIARERLPRLLDGVVESIRELVKTSPNPEKEVREVLDGWSVPALGLKVSGLMPPQLVEVSHKEVKRLVEDALKTEG